MQQLRPLDLPGWDSLSIWGYDPGTQSFYAQLTHNNNTDDDGPDVWITPGTAWPVINSTHELSGYIARATGEPTSTIKSAMGLT